MLTDPLSGCAASRRRLDDARYERDLSDPPWPVTAAIVSVRARGTSGTSRWWPARTTGRPETTTSRTSAGDAAKTTDSARWDGAAPARRTESRDTVTRSAYPPGVRRPASGQP